MVDRFVVIMDVVVHWNHSVEPFFYIRGAECILVMKMHGRWIEAIETSLWVEFMGGGCCCIIGKFYIW